MKYGSKIYSSVRRLWAFRVALIRCFAVLVILPSTALHVVPSLSGSRSHLHVFVRMRLPPADVFLSWPSPNYENPKTRGDALLIVNSVLIGLTIVTVGLRLCTLKRNQMRYSR
jgi:hypothetical protein